MASIKDVAKLAGVSNATVSRVLGNKEYVRESTRQKVLRAADELGYKPNRVARSLRVRSSQIIGLIISDIQNPFFTSLVRAVEDIAYKNNYAIFLCNSDEDSNKEALYVDLMLSENVAGVIITPARELNCPSRKLIDANIPTVSVDRRVLDCEVDTVVLDNVGGAYKLINHLIENGHTKIGAILGLLEITTGRERLEGYKLALSDHNIPFDKNLVKAGIPKHDLGFRYTKELFNSSDPPTALFTGNNLLAVGAIKAINELNLNIPKDVSFVSFDNQEWSSLIYPGITVISQPTYELGRSAIELIMKRIDEPSRSPELILIEPEIIIRKSVMNISDN